MRQVAVLGCGYWGSNYVRLLHELPQARLALACDLDPQRLQLMQRRFPLLAVTTDPEQVWQDPAIEAVIIATPAATHYELADRALRAGKHVLVEKPLTTCVSDAEALVETAQSCGRTLMVGLTFLYNNGALMMKDLIAHPSFGRRYYLHLTRTNLGIVRPDVDVVWDLAAHDLAICDFLLDRRPLWVQANGVTVLEHEHADVAFITLGYPDNVMANIHVSWVDPNKVREVVAVGSQRRIVFDDLNQTERLRIYEKGITSSRKEADSYGEFRLLVRDGDIISPRLTPGEPLRQQVEHFLTCIAGGVSPLSDGRVAADNVRSLAAVQRSLALGGLRVPLHDVSAAPDLVAVAA
jgi:predicted dehydrogenase